MLSIRLASIPDIPQMIDLLVDDAKRRTALDPLLWPNAEDVRARLDASLRTSFESTSTAPRQLWLLAEGLGGFAAIAHAMLVPVPPIYGIKEGQPGLILDDCYVSAEAPNGTAEALLAATEAALREAGAAALIASCPDQGPWRPLYEAHQYDPVTLYMVKHGLSDHGPAPEVKPARQEDVARIVKLSAAHRATLAKLNPRFWQLHPDADSRFEKWMQYSLTLTDRDMIVDGARDKFRGYAIAQPVARLLIPAAHDIAAIGVIDDFYDQDFADASVVANDGASAAVLLSAAESAFARRKFAAALAVCPAAWASKRTVLERQGFQVAKLWMLKR